MSTGPIPTRLAGALLLALVSACRGGDAAPARQTLIDSRSTYDPRSLDPAHANDIPSGRLVAEIFDGPHYGAIFGAVTVPLTAGGAAGPWVAGVVHDITGSYRPAFLIAIACCMISAASIWIAAPRKVRMVPGRIPRL